MVPLAHRLWPLLLVAVACSRGPVQEQDLDVLDTSIHYRQAGPMDGDAVLLLHGAAYTSADWERIGTLQLLADAGFRAIALDLPSKGESGDWNHVVEGFLLEFVDALQLETCAVVAPSMSGAYALPFVTLHPHRVRAFIPVAPIRIPHFLSAARTCPVPTLVLWGSEDQTIPLRHGQDLTDALPSARLHVLEGGSHAFYLEDPDPFHHELLGFLGSGGSLGSGG